MIVKDNKKYYPALQFGQHGSKAPYEPEVIDARRRYRGSTYERYENYRKANAKPGYQSNQV